MNYIFLVFGIILVYFLMVLFYKFGKKEGLFLYISLMSLLLGVVMYMTIDFFSFQVDFGIPIIMGIFICSNIIIQRYGSDETGKIVKYYVIPYVFINIIFSLFTLINSAEYDLVGSNAFDYLFGYSLNSLRVMIGYLLSMGFMLWYNCYMYYHIRKNKNKLLFSNIGTMLIIQFIESIIFVFISYSGLFDINLTFGMIVIRYLLKIIIGFMGLVPVSVIMKLKDK